MIADTIVVMVMMVSPSSPPQQENRFRTQFEKADSTFNKEYKIEIEELKQAAGEAAKTADIKTARQREEALRGVCDFKEIINKYFKQQ